MQSFFKRPCEGKNPEPQKEEKEKAEQLRRLEEIKKTIELLKKEQSELLHKLGRDTIFSEFDKIKGRLFSHYEQGEILKRARESGRLSMGINQEVVSILGDILFNPKVSEEFLTEFKKRFGTEKVGKPEMAYINSLGLLRNRILQQEEEPFLPQIQKMAQEEDRKHKNKNYNVVDIQELAERFQKISEAQRLSKGQRLILEHLIKSKQTEGHQDPQKEYERLLDVERKINKEYERLRAGMWFACAESPATFILQFYNDL